jgi:hypothetical protein
VCPSRKELIYVLRTGFKPCPKQSAQGGEVTYDGIGIYWDFFHAGILFQKNPVVTILFGVDSSDLFPLMENA